MLYLPQTWPSFHWWVVSWACFNVVTQPTKLSHYKSGLSPQQSIVQLSNMTHLRLCEISCNCNFYNVRMVWKCIHCIFVLLIFFLFRILSTKEKSVFFWTTQNTTLGKYVLLLDLRHTCSSIHCSTAKHEVNPNCIIRKSDFVRSLFEFLMSKTVISLQSARIFG